MRLMLAPKDHSICQTSAPRAWGGSRAERCAAARVGRYVLAMALVVFVHCAAAVAQGASRVEFIIGTEPGVQSVSLQQWYRTVTEAGAAKLDIRAARAGEKVEIVTRDAPSGTVYVVYARLSARGELVVPGGKFRASDRAKLAAWIKEVDSAGPPAAPGEARPFGLATTDFAKVREDLSQPTATSTAGIERRAALEQLRKDLSLKLVDHQQFATAIVPQDLVAEELRGLTRGTALACLLRPAGLAVQPRRGANGQIEYHVARLEDVEEAWPVGLAAEDNARETLPGLFDFLTAEVAGRPVTDVVDAVAAHVQAPILIDHYALAAQGIDPTKALVSHPKKRTYYLALLRTVLFQAKLTSQLRTDEAGRPFVWITTIQAP